MGGFSNQQETATIVQCAVKNFESSVQLVGFAFGITTEASNVHVNLHCSHSYPAG